MQTNLRPFRHLPVVLAAAVILLSVAGGTAPGPQLQRAIHRGREVVAGEVLVKFRGARSAAPSADEIRWLADTDRDEELGRLGVRRLRSRSLDVAGLLAALAARADVEYAEPNFVVHAIGTVPNDSQFGILWGLRNMGQAIVGKAGVSGADIEATAAWDITTGSRANVVAVIDTGVDYNHPDLQANVWSAPSAFSVKIGSRTITCAAGTHGFNAIALTCDPMDDNNHGTHVSGTIGAAGNNGRGVVGVNWVASVMGAKFLDANGSGTIADAINAIDFAIQAKQFFGAGANVRVLSNSWGGGGFSQSLLNAINKANANDLLFVAAAGNTGANNDAVAFYPSNYNAPNVVAVAATDNRDLLASYSNYGATTVELGAPGTYIASTVRNNGYAYYSGTSMAAPHVSGAAALILSACSLSTDLLRTTILNTVDLVPALAGKTMTGGRLNVFNALNGCVAPPAAPTGLSATVVGSQVNLDLDGQLVERVRLPNRARHERRCMGGDRDGGGEGDELHGRDDRSIYPVLVSRLRLQRGGRLGRGVECRDGGRAAGDSESDGGPGVPGGGRDADHVDGGGYRRSRAAPVPVLALFLRRCDVVDRPGLRFG